MKITAYQCPVCKNIIFSRARHDFRWCSCGISGIAVDGGFDYTRICYSAEKGKPHRLEIEINCTKKELYDDWSKNINKFGVIYV